MFFSLLNVLEETEFGGEEFAYTFICNNVYGLENLFQKMLTFNFGKWIHILITLEGPLIQKKESSISQ